MDMRSRKRALGDLEIKEESEDMPLYKRVKPEEIEPDVGEEEINLCESAESAHSSNSDHPVAMEMDLRRQPMDDSEIKQEPDDPNSFNQIRPEEAEPIVLEEDENWCESTESSHSSKSYNHRSFDPIDDIINSIHISREHVQYEPYVCNVCQARAPTSEEIESHSVTEHGTANPTVSYECNKAKSTYLRDLMTEAVIITGRRLSKKQLNTLCPSTIRPPRTNLVPIVPPQTSSFISLSQPQDQKPTTSKPPAPDPVPVSALVSNPASNSDDDQTVTVYCRICHRDLPCVSVQDIEALQDHVSIHMYAVYNVPRYKCKYCQFCAGKMKTLQIHYLSHHPDSEFAYIDKIQSWETFVVKKLSYYCFKMSEFVSDCINSLNILKCSGIKYGPTTPVNLLFHKLKVVEQQPVKFTPKIAQLPPKPVPRYADGTRVMFKSKSAPQNQDAKEAKPGTSS
ncbi:hypothetical protein WR25_24889 [Diploscapter pachys]|uniref:C2H2-type domain-containing protein n=1 Tax=Diploscapter pachys TaxID=2018661 RepID=A0A2A2LHV4_9BILA|nr:hypothetical protein WR25_24889 [Diploscapter pachys]